MSNLELKNTFRDNPHLKKSGIQIRYTQHQINEYKKCANDPIYFIKKHVKILTLDEGLIPFNLYPFQEKLIHTIIDNRFTIAKILRQAGKTVTVIGYLLWLTLFTKEQNILIAANKKQTACDILEKYKLAYENIPVWLQQGVMAWNDGNIELENSCRIRATSTTSGTARSGSYNFILLDEFAHIQGNMANDFYRAVYPVISSGKKSKIVMISTPNGLNLFYKFWTDAMNKKNGFIPFEVSWRDVPGRDQAWYEDTLENIGEEKFKIEFECAFLGSSNTLISGIKLQGMVYIDPILKRGSEDNIVDIYDEPIKEHKKTITTNRIHPDGYHASLDSKYNTKTTGGIEEEEEEVIEIEHKYVIIVDPAEGKKLDYSAFSVIDITKIPYKQVAKFYSNTISPILFPSIIYDVARYYNNAMVLIELQSTGLQIADILHHDLEYEFILRVTSGNKKSQQISAGHVKNSAPGVKTTGPVKRIGCANLKTLIETDQLIINDFDTIQELTTFCLSTKGTYEAASDADSDDLCMSLVLFGWLTTQKYFKELVTHDLRKELQRSVLHYDDEEMLPSLSIDDGLMPELDDWGGSLWVPMSLENSYVDPYNQYFQSSRRSL